MSQSDAYRDAYTNTNMSEKTIWAKASALAKKDKVRDRIAELRGLQALPRIMSATERLEWLTKVIRSNDEITADKLKASDQMNKMQGEYVQKVITTTVDKLEDLI